MASTRPRLKKATLARIALERFWVSDFRFKEIGVEQIALDVRVAVPEITHDDALPGEYQVLLRLSASDGRRNLDLTIVGTFHVPEGGERFLLFNAPSMLYGVGRGLVATLTSITEAGRMDLPSINIAELVERR